MPLLFIKQIQPMDSKMMRFTNFVKSSIEILYLISYHHKYGASTGLAPIQVRRITTLSRIHKHKQKDNIILVEYEEEKFRGFAGLKFSGSPNILGSHNTNMIRKKIIIIIPNKSFKTPRGLLDPVW
ncbi:hypothetical protein Avbf_11602 [Armadillidium vulgare]|nr:hypothetical protein Avbf_11602 [Armadillidium vulgare]